MSDAYDGFVGELVTDDVLDLLIAGGVDVGGSFVEDEDGTISEEGPGEAKKLAFTDGEVRAGVFDLTVEVNVAELDTLEGRAEVLVGVGTPGVEVRPDGALG